MDRVTELINHIGKGKYEKLKNLFTMEIFYNQNIVVYNELNSVILDDILSDAIEHGSDMKLLIFATNVKNGPVDKIIDTLSERNNIGLVNILKEQVNKDNLIKARMK